MDGKEKRVYMDLDDIRLWTRSPERIECSAQGHDENTRQGKSKGSFID